MRKIFTLCFAFLFTGSIFAQNVEKVVFDENGSPAFIQFGADKSMDNVDSKSAIKQFVYKGKRDQMQSVGKSADELGITHEKFQQYFDGIPVEYGTYSAQKRNNKLIAIHGDYIAIESNLNTNPQISEQRALELALQFVGAKTYMWENEDNEAFARQSEVS